MKIYRKLLIVSFCCENVYSSLCVFGRLISVENRKPKGEMKKFVLLVIAVLFVAACKDFRLCVSARNDATMESWEAYLEQFPEGKCAGEGKVVRNKFKKIGGFER